MISRRRFLIFMSLLAATFSTHQASAKPKNNSFVLNDSNELCIYDGWILRASDLNDIEFGGKYVN